MSIPLKVLELWLADNLGHRPSRKVSSPNHRLDSQSATLNFQPLQSVDKIAFLT